MYKNTKQAINLSKYDNGGFDRGAGRLKEAAWMVVKYFCLQSHIPLPSKFRAFLLRRFGAKVGTGVVIRAGVNITFPWRLTIGDHCWIGEGVTILSLAPVAIGDHCCLSQRAFLCTGSHDFHKESFDLITKPITVGARSWIAAGAFLSPGATVPADTLVKAYEVVTANQYSAFDDEVDLRFDEAADSTLMPSENAKLTVAPR